MNHIITVSYTHLDVYKRQVLDYSLEDNVEITREVSMKFGADKLFAMVDNSKVVKAVSYTHLDVYKRQGYGGNRPEPYLLSIPRVGDFCIR